MSEQYDPSNILNSEGCVYVRYEVYAALQAENERLRKAGDEMDAFLLLVKFGAANLNAIQEVRGGWLAAKGVQP